MRPAYRPRRQKFGRSGRGAAAPHAGRAAVKGSGGRQSRRRRRRPSRPAQGCRFCGLVPAGRRLRPRSLGRTPRRPSRTRRRCGGAERIEDAASRRLLRQRIACKCGRHSGGNVRHRGEGRSPGAASLPQVTGARHAHAGPRPRRHARGRHDACGCSCGRPPFRPRAETVQARPTSCHGVIRGVCYLASCRRSIQGQGWAGLRGDPGCLLSCQLPGLVPYPETLPPPPRG